MAGQESIQLVATEKTSALKQFIDEFDMPFWMNRQFPVWGEHLPTTEPFGWPVCRPYEIFDKTDQTAKAESRGWFK
jgi:hypothetical protein